MNVNLDIEFKVLFIVVVITFLVIAVIGILQYYKNLMSKRVFLYGFIPASVLPSAVVMTYIVWPGNTLNLVTRLLIAIVIEIVVILQVYFISFPLYKAMIPGVRKYFENDENMKSE